MDQLPKSENAVYKFLAEHPTAHLATVMLDGKPSVATVYIYTNSMMEIFIATLEETQKFLNIETNHNVALVVTDEETQQTVQLQGTAAEEPNPDVRMAMIEQLAKLQARNKSGWPPPIVKLNKGKIKLVKIKPSWVRFSDFKDPEKVIQYETS